VKQVAARRGGRAACLFKSRQRLQGAARSRRPPPTSANGAIQRRVVSLKLDQNQIGTREGELPLNDASQLREQHNGYQRGNNWPPRSARIYGTDGR
jgi:hypothetical protein